MTRPAGPTPTGTLMISVSGIRGIVGVDLTPEIVARYAAGLGAWAKTESRNLVVLGRDTRTSGEMFAAAAAAGIQSAGCDVIDLGIVATPTTQLAVEYHHAGAGLMISASHNPVEWNALKFIGADGVFLDLDSGAQVRALAERGPPRAGWDAIGTTRVDAEAIARHLELVLALPCIDVDAIRARGFRVALDCVRGAGGLVIPLLLERLGCEVSVIHATPDGRFPRDPEPAPKNLVELAAIVRESRSDIGMAVDPDVDRLALVDETGQPIGEDYTLAFAVRAVLQETVVGDGRRPRVVTNLSTSRVVEDAAMAYGGTLVRTPVGEAHVARGIRDAEALIGGEGNGGVILPSLHLGRDAPLGVALVLQYLVSQEGPVSALIQGAPQYRIVKAKVRRPRGAPELERLYVDLEEHFAGAVVDRRDGLWLGWPDRWLHVRPSGTEPVIRMIAEAPTEAEAENLIAVCRGML